MMIIILDELNSGSSHLIRDLRVALAQAGTADQANEDIKWKIDAGRKRCDFFCGGL